MDVPVPGGMFQIAAGSNLFYDFYSSFSGVSVVEDALTPLPIDCVVMNFTFEVDVAPGVGNTWIMTIYHNGIDTGQDIQLTGTQTRGTTSFSIAASAGDTIAYGVVSSGSPATVNARFGSVVRTSGKKSVIFGGMGSPSNTGTLYQLFSGGNQWNATESLRRNVFPTSGTISKLYVYFISDGSNPTKGFTLTVMKNGVAQTLAKTVTEPGGVFSDLVNSVSLVDGDVISMRQVTVNSPTITNVILLWSVLFVPTTNGENVYMAGATSPSNSATRYMFPYGGGNVGALGAEEQVSRLVETPTATFSKLRVLLSSAPGASKSYQVALRKNASTTSQSVTISGTDTTATSTTTVSGLRHDLFNTIIIPSGTPSSPSLMSISLVMKTRGANTGLFDFFESSGGNNLKECKPNS